MLLIKYYFVIPFDIERKIKKPKQKENIICKKKSRFMCVINAVVLLKKIFFLTKMTSCFSPLENLSLLINNLISSDDNVYDNVLSLKYIDKLLNDLTKSLSESSFYDVEIKVGVNKDIKIFKAHSTILEARSPYFKVALSSDWLERSDNGIILFEKENISPKIFEVLLIYFYNGTININNLSSNETLELLEACVELKINELVNNNLIIHLFKIFLQWNH